jgi:hypothetical protein
MLQGILCISQCQTLSIRLITYWHYGKHIWNEINFLLLSPSTTALFLHDNQNLMHDFQNCVKSRYLVTTPWSEIKSRKVTDYFAALQTHWTLVHLLLTEMNEILNLQTPLWTEWIFCLVPYWISTLLRNLYIQGLLFRRISVNKQSRTGEDDGSRGTYASIALFIFAEEVPST